VSAELIDTADGSTQWSERYDRPYKDLFALQDEITRAVAGALLTKLLPGEHAATQSDLPPGGSLEAYNALLHGQFSQLRSTEADTRKAIESYTLATQLDPQYALAWSELSRAWTYLGTQYRLGEAAQEVYAKAREAADRALALSPELARAHLARGYLLRANFDWHGAEAIVARWSWRRMTARRSSGSGTCSRRSARWCRQSSSRGRRSPLIRCTPTGMNGSPLISSASAVSMRRSRRPAGASSYSPARRPITRRSRSSRSSVAMHQRRSPPRSKSPPGYWQDSALALARQIGSDRAAADAALRTMVEKNANIFPYGIAEAYALRNKGDETFAWLDQAWTSRDVSIAILLYDPLILRYKDDPRFAAFCRKVGLPAPVEVRKQT
jgi:tetratricopeptide (TPR) repeat protein